MLELELRTRRGGQHHTATTVTVNNDGSYTVVQHDHADLDVEETVIADKESPNGRLRIADNPERWVRLSHRAYRSGYVVAVITKDDTQDAPTTP